MIELWVVTSHNLWSRITHDTIAIMWVLHGIMCGVKGAKIYPAI